ncbi:hypothetical protein [Mailhella sp.]
MKLKTLFISICCVLLTELACAAPPAPDLFADYNSQINSEADAKAVNVFEAWAGNMEYLIRHKVKDGIVVDGAADTDQYTSDGLGNITIKEGAKVDTIINNQRIENTTVIIDNKDSKH